MSYFIAIELKYDNISQIPTIKTLETFQITKYRPNRIIFIRGISLTKTKENNPFKNMSISFISVNKTAIS